jgi:hypothetical protein
MLSRNICLNFIFTGVITNIFNMLYDEEVISEESFKLWEKALTPRSWRAKVPAPCS